jgi:quinol monooxygenase YgiN
MTSTTPVVLVALLDVKPGGEDEALAALETVIEASHTEEDCVKYALHRDNQTPTRFVFVEKWNSQAALDAHMQTPHYKELGEKLGSLLAAAPLLSITTALPFGDETKGAI